MTLPTDYHARKAFPIFTFLTEYFPDAIEELVHVSVAGNAQHANDGSKIRWAREKSTDQMNTAMRHMWDHATVGPKDTDNRYHLAKAAWRNLAQLQLTIEHDKAIQAEYDEQLEEQARYEAAEEAYERSLALADATMRDRMAHDFYGDVD